MEKLPMCRLCLAENVRMYVVINKDLHQLYERLTDHPFVTKDSRPMLACFICCTKLKQCCQLQRKCLEAEELLTQMMNEDCEHNPLTNRDQFGCFNGFIQSPMVHVSINSDDECQTECDAIKEEFIAVWERLDDIIEPEEEHQSDELEPENLYSNHSDGEDIPAQQSESDSEDYVPLIKIKTEVEEEQEPTEPTKKRRASDTTRAPDANKPRLQTRRTKLEDVITEEVKGTEQSDTKVFRTTENCTSKPDPESEEPPTIRKNCIKKYNEEYIKCKLTNIGVESDNINEICQRRFNKKRNLTNHIRAHTDEKPFKCEICQSCFRRKAHLINHIRTHTGEKPFKCETCQRCFGKKVHLTSHISTHTNEKPFRCDSCQKCFRRKTYLTRHIRTHTGEKPFKCDICHSFFRRKGHLTTHIRTHTGEKPFKCEICLHRYTNKGDLTKHIRTHTGEKPFKCEVCQRRFNEKNDLKKHIHTHTGEKPFKCDVCQRCFSIKNLLTNHTRIHAGAKPFKCDICQRCFRSRGNLKSHLRTHTGEKHYKCDICQRRFSEKSNLTSHIRTHTGERPYKCNICQSSFTRKTFLKRHISTHTGETFQV